MIIINYMIMNKLSFQKKLKNQNKNLLKKLI